MAKKTETGFWLILLVSFVVIGCSTFPAYDTLPETHPVAAYFIGSWWCSDAWVIVPFSDGSSHSVKGQQSYYFYDDGTGEVIDTYEGVVTNRRVFRYRISDTLIGFQFLKGTLYTNGGSFSRPYVLSDDGRTITFPYEKAGIISYFSKFTITKTAPEPEPPPTLTPEPSPIPLPVPAPLPAPSSVPAPVDNSGQIYYSYDGIGYVYIDNNVFYRCSNGNPVGYVESGVIYAFSGDVLGFLEGSFIYDRNGKPLGAPDPKDLGKDAAGKKSVTKAGKQSLPAKQSKSTVNKPKLRNGYFGGVLRDMFN
jgi:hypothetical protein